MEDLNKIEILKKVDHALLKQTSTWEEIKVICDDATKHDIQSFKNNIRNEKGIKAAGGISSFLDAKDFIDNGVTRLGTSRLVNLIKK